MTKSSPWMDTREAAIYLRFVNDDGSPNLERLHQWLNTTGRRRGVEKVNRGRSILLSREEVDNAIKPTGGR